MAERDPRRCASSPDAPAQSRPLYHNAPFIVSHTALFAGGSVTGMVKFDAAEALRLIEEPRPMGQFRPDHDAPDLGAARRRAQRYDLSSLKIAFHMAAPMPAWLKEKWIEWLGPERIYEPTAARSGRAPRSSPAPNGSRTRGRSAGRRHPLLRTSARRQQVGTDRRNLFLPKDGVGTTYHYIGAEPSAASTDGNRSATSAASMPTAISISATASPT